MVQKKWLNSCEQRFFIFFVFHQMDVLKSVKMTLSMVLLSRQDPQNKGVSYVSTLQQKTLGFNKKIIISNVGGNIFFSGWSITGKRVLPQNSGLNSTCTPSGYCGHTPPSKTWSHCHNPVAFLQQIAGYSIDSVATTLRHNTIFQVILKRKNLLRNQPSVTWLHKWLLVSW